MLDDKQSPQEFFQAILVTVVGQAFTAAGYRLEEKPTQWAGGRFRFVKLLDDGNFDDELFAFIEFQLLAYADTEWSSGMPSRFNVTLIRSDQPNAATTTNHDDFIRRDLSTLVVEDFGVPILPSARHWWTFSNTDELGKALAEAGHLVIGYGMPWLAGELHPPEEDDTPPQD